MKIVWKALAFPLTLLASNVLFAADAVNVSADTLLARTQKRTHRWSSSMRAHLEEYAQGHVPGATN